MRTQSVALILVAGLCCIALGWNGADVAQDDVTRRLEDLETRIHRLEFPELAPRDAASIKLLEGKVRGLEHAHASVAALRQAGRRRGDLLTFARTGQRAARAKAELAWAEGEIAKAVAASRESVLFARLSASAAEAAYNRDDIQIEEFTDSKITLLDSEAAEARARLLAALAKIDATELEKRLGTVEQEFQRGGTDSRSR